MMPNLLGILFSLGKVISKPSDFPADVSEVYWCVYKYSILLSVFYNCNYMFHRAKWVEICRSTYKKPCIVLEIEDDFPVFGRLITIYVLDKKIIFSVQVLHTHSFDPHFHSYRVNNTTNTRCVSYDELLSYMPLHERVISGHVLVSLKYQLH